MLAAVAGVFTPASFSLTNIPATPSISTSQQPPSATVNSSIADQATVSGGDNPTGTVTFTLYNNPNGTGTPLFTDPNEPLSGGVATSKGYTATATGTDYWVATYNGDSSNNPVSSGNAAEPVTINQASTTTTITASATSSSFGQAVTFTATVTANPSGPATPTGLVDFFDTTTGNDLGTAPLSASGGTATLTISSLTPGSHTIEATYKGDTNFLTSSSTQNATVTVGPSLIVLNKTASGCSQVTGASTINVTGPVYVDSSSSSAVVASGSGKVVAAAGIQGGIHVVGRVSVSGGASLSPTPVTGAAALPDPLPGLQPPTGLPSQGSVSLSNSSTKTINPGIYSSISVTGNAQLKLSPGVYVITGGGFTVGNSAQVTGSGVLIYNAGGAINFSGNSKVQLLAATMGTYAGIVLYQPLGNTQTISLGNSSVQTLQGVVYASGALVSVSGTDQLSETGLVANEVLVQGSGTTIVSS